MHIKCTVCDGNKTVPLFTWFPYLGHKDCPNCGGSGETYVQDPPRAPRVRHHKPSRPVGPILPQTTQKELPPAPKPETVQRRVEDDATFSFEVTTPIFLHPSRESGAIEEAPKPRFVSGAGGNFGGGGASKDDSENVWPDKATPSATDTSDASNMCVRETHEPAPTPQETMIAAPIAAPEPPPPPPPPSEPAPAPPAPEPSPG